MKIFGEKDALCTLETQDGARRTCLVLDVTGFTSQGVEMVKKGYWMVAEAMKLSGSTNHVLADELGINGNSTADESENETDDDSNEDQFIETKPVTEPAKRGKNDKTIAPHNILDKVEAQNKDALAKSQIPPAGWNEDATRKSLEMLPKAQKNVLLQAVANGGQVSRAQTYIAAGFEPTRSLKGFTRPVRGVMAHLKKEGLLPDDAKPLLDTIYDPEITTYKPVQGFVVPLEVVVCMRNMGLGLDPSANA